MPTVGHVAVGLVAGELLATRVEVDRTRCLMAGVGLALLPDLDILSAIANPGPFSMWGHRGAAHSAVAAVAMGAGFALVAGSAWGRPWRRSLWAIMTVLSHSVLDLLNVGGIVAWLWPWVPRFVVVGWQPIPSVEKTSDLLTRAAVPVVGIEILEFTPLLILAWWLGQRNRRREERSSLAV